MIKDYNIQIGKGFDKIKLGMKEPEIKKILGEPEEIDEIERRIKQLEIEREAIKREGSKEKVDEISKQISELDEERKKHKAKWESEKNILDKIQENKEAIEQYKIEAQQAERDGDYGKVAELRYGKMQEAENELERLQKELEEAQGELQNGEWVNFDPREAVKLLPEDQH